MADNNNMFLEYGYTSLNKFGEELCGDRVKCVQKDGYTTLVLADGLGSGVKANILATLTSKILSTMVSNNISIRDCIETVIQTLPVCKVRGIAYSTFSVVHVDQYGKGVLIEFDNPQAIYYHNGRCVDLIRNETIVCDKKVYHSEVKLKDGDILFVMSDGVLHAGIGFVLNFGWDRKEIKGHLERNLKPEMSARSAACLLASACNDLYIDKPGDDTTVAAIKIREKIKVNIMVGPPADKAHDDLIVSKFLVNCDKRVVCGGTSSQIVARHLDKQLKTSFDFIEKDVPPIGFIDGIDLVTEGVLTLRKLLELSKKYLSPSDLTPKTNDKQDGASLLAKVLFEEASHIEFYVGQSVNAAHQGLPIDTTMKFKLIEALSDNLEKMGKKVEVNYN